MERSRSRSRVIRFSPENYERARALFPAPPETEVKPDDVIGYVLDLVEQQRKGERESAAEHGRQ